MCSTLIHYQSAKMIKNKILPFQTIARQSYNIQSRLYSISDEDKIYEQKEKELERIAKELADEQTGHLIYSHRRPWTPSTPEVINYFSKFQASIDEPPTACCRSGCANCVFIVWAEAITAKMKDAGPEVCEKILKIVDDPSLQAYLEMELRIRGLKK